MIWVVLHWFRFVLVMLSDIHRQPSHVRNCSLRPRVLTLISWTRFALLLKM